MTALRSVKAKVLSGKFAGKTATKSIEGARPWGRKLFVGIRKGKLVIE